MGTSHITSRVRCCSRIKNIKLEEYREQTLIRCCICTNFSLHKPYYVLERTRHCFYTLNNYECYRIVLDRRKLFSFIRFLTRSCCRDVVELGNHAKHISVDEQNRYDAAKGIHWTNDLNSDPTLIQTFFTILVGAFCFWQLLAETFSLDNLVLPLCCCSICCLYIDCCVYLFLAVDRILSNVVCYLCLAFLIDIFSSKRNEFEGVGKFNEHGQFVWNRDDILKSNTFC